MKAVVLGAGMMGKALAHDLKKSACETIIADVDKKRVETAAKDINCQGAVCDVSQETEVIAVLKDCDVAISAVPYFFNVNLAHAAIKTGCHFCDLGGNTSIVMEELSLHEKAAKNNVLIIPDCGFAPGMANVIVGLSIKETKAHTVNIRVGGLPQNPQPPLNYTLLFSIHGLINEYKEPATVIRNGKIKTVNPLSELEEIRFPPFGVLEAFQTSGGTSTLSYTYSNVLTELDCKTIRYPGYCAKMKALSEMGMFSEEPIEVNGCKVTPRAVLSKVMEHTLPHQDKDVALLRIYAHGEKEIVYEMVDYYNESLHMTAMARTTAFPTSIIAQMMVDTIQERGAFPPEKVVPGHKFIEELAKRDIIIKKIEK
ncbi:MAG: saccharopine dehydrogenase C-terminal domain-containing protein [Candidatus Methanofastidiosia archaeon]|jgi:lysine 6-dehydrogenase